ncbi:MAG TPA: hypothetical protein VJS13_02505 [Pyrinomonadaceae bacterium]|nr:hypothetical protein [Pyrinomonadaceae bacterium]
MNGDRSTLKNFANLTPTIRVEVYIPIRSESAYHDSLTWVIDELTRVHGGCTVNENVSGHYLSRAGQIIDDRVDVVYSDIALDWNKSTERTEVLNYCVKLKQFLLKNLVEEEILVSAYPVSHVVARSSA